MTSTSISTDGIIELYILNKIHNIPIIVYNSMMEVMYIFDGDKFHHYLSNKTLSKSKLEQYPIMKDAIHIKYTFNMSNHTNIPNQIDVLYIN